MSDAQQWAGEQLSNELRTRHQLAAKAEPHGEIVENFVARFPKHRLYEVKERAPYSVTGPGALVLIVDYRFDTIKEHEEDHEDKEVVRCRMIRSTGGAWGVDGTLYWLAPKYLQRVDEEKYGIELDT